LIVSLIADVLVRRGTFTLDAQLTVADGETLALLGPNGSGKSTLLAAIAGLLAPECGSVEVGGRVLTKTGAGGREVMVAAHERRVGLLGQDPLLFPHLSARENVAFGRRARGSQVAVARTDADAWLEAVGLTGFADRRPAQLSGGQQQRVAIARALAAQPDVLLLDEPMAALDVRNASAVRTLLRERLRASALPTIVVSHDVVDAMVLADRVAILDEGRIVDMGDTATVLGQPRNQFAAALVGVNLVQGKLQSDGCVRDTQGRVWSGAPVSAAVDLPQPGDSVTVTFPPNAVRLAAPRTEGVTPSWRATVGALEPAVHGIRIRFAGEEIVAELTPAEILAAGIHEGMTVSVSVDPALVAVYAVRELRG
jgi:molybdate transport system ATP-binding protein